MFPPERTEPSTLGTLVFLMWGLIVWGLQFTAVYVGHTWVCALGLPEAASGTIVIALTILAVALIFPVAYAPARTGAIVGLGRGDEDSSHLGTVARVIAILSIMAALWTGMTAFFVQSCALGR